MNRIWLLVAAVSLIALTGCGDTPRVTTTGARPATQAVPTPSTTAATPRDAGAEVTVSHDGSRGARYRSGGRSWQSCGTTVYEQEAGDDLYGIAVSGPVSCTAGTAVMIALARQVQRHVAAGEDCFPGYCTADHRRPTTVTGYHCSATDHGDVSISLSILCRHGNRYVSAGAADDE